MPKSSNRLKSTEKLIESDASTTEEVVPPLDLSKCRQSIGSTFSESSPNTTDKKQRVVVVDRADIHRTEEHPLTAPPIPAARKSLAKNRRKSNETSIIQLQNDKSTVMLSKRTVKSQAMDLIAMAPEIKPRIKKTLFGGKGDSVMDETTSFITYDEKHETEETNEKEEHQSDSDGTHCTNVSNQSVGGGVNDSPVEKKSLDEDIVSSAGERDGADALEEQKEGTISITLHETSPLRFDASIRSPRVRISIYETSTGHMLRRRVGSNGEEGVEEPILSHCSRLKESNELECIWPKDPVHIDEDIRTIRNGNVVIFFELIDNPPTRARYKRNKNGSTDGRWLHVCWAFLKPSVASNSFSNIGIKCCLQLYEYQRLPGKSSTIFDQWKMKRKLYPGCLMVTLNEHKQRLSPMPGAKADDPPLELSRLNSSETSFNETILLTQASLQNGMSNVWTRLPGQQCKCPNAIIYQHTPALKSHGGDQLEGGGGSMVAKFNPSGTMLALHCQSNAKNAHEICVLLLASMKVTLNLSGHRSIVYDLDWADDTMLVSVSSDCTAIVWFLQKKSYSMRVLPHPTFVYAVRCLNFRAPASDEYLFIATGGRDCVLRIWRVLRSKLPDDSERAAVDLCDEFDDHGNYITALAVTKRATKLYSADWNGEIFEWRRRQSAKYNLDSVYRMKRKLKSFPFSVSQIELDPKGHRLYAQGVNDPLIHSIEITSGIVIQSIGEPHVQCTVGRQTFAFSACGSLLFKSNGGAKIHCWNQLNEQHVTTIKLPIVGGRAFISSLIYHPSKLLLVCTVYGDAKGTCMLLMSYENISQTQQPLQSIDADGDDKSYEQIEEPSPKKFAPPVTRTFGTFGNILNRIDDLFAMAMKSPNCTDDYKQRKQFEISLQQLKAPVQLLSSDLNGSEQAIDSNSNSTEAGDNGRPTGETSERAENIDHSDSSSTQSSNNTFTLEKAPKSDKDVGDANDNHTFNVEDSDQNSNATFEIENERGSSEGSTAIDAIKKKS